MSDAITRGEPLQARQDAVGQGGPPMRDKLIFAGLFAAGLAILERHGGT